MKDLQQYVDNLFRHERPTPEVQDLKEEILSNMRAKRDDLMAQGLSVEQATLKAQESLSAIDELIDGNQLTDVRSYHLACLQTLFLNCIVFWIFSLPLLFTCYAPSSYIGLFCVIISGAMYLSGRGKNDAAVAVMSLSASARRRKIAWIIWTVFFLVAIGTMAALTFASDIWFGRPLQITGPYQLANIAVRFYLPLLTVIIPITISNFSKNLLKCRKEPDNE